MGVDKVCTVEFGKIEKSFSREKRDVVGEPVGEVMVEAGAEIALNYFRYEIIDWRIPNFPYMRVV